MTASSINDNPRGIPLTQLPETRRQGPLAAASQMSR